MAGTDVKKRFDSYDLITTTPDSAKILIFDTQNDKLHNQTKGNLLSEVKASIVTNKNDISDLSDKIDNIQSNEEILQKQIAKAISGQIEGKEGRWKFELSGAVTPNKILFQDYGAGAVTLIRRENVEEFSGVFGIRTQIPVDFYGVIIGDSGAEYTAYCVAANTNTDVYLIPEHGDVRADFTVGNSYTVKVFKESTALEDQQTGTRDVVEYFAGNDLVKNFETVLPVGSYGTLNAGYWDGKVWKSQLLGDVEVIDSGTPQARIKLKWSDKLTALPAFSMRKADGTWQPYVAGDALAQFGYTRSDIENVGTINIGSSYAALGYASEAGLLASSAACAEYQTKARVWRPIANPAEVLIIDNFVYLQNYYTSWAAVANELVDHVFTGNSNRHTFRIALLDKGVVTPIKKLWGVAGYYPAYDTANVLSATTDKTAVAMIFGLANINGTLHDVVWFKELIYDEVAGNWGDSGKIPIVDNVVTTKDDNGNDILTGCMGSDTGIPA